MKLPPIRDRLPNEDNEARRERLINAASRLWGDNELNFDVDAKLSDPEDGSGTWVQAWVWIDFEQYPEENE